MEQQDVIRKTGKPWCKTKQSRWRRTGTSTRNKSQSVGEQRKPRRKTKQTRWRRPETSTGKKRKQRARSDHPIRRSRSSQVHALSSSRCVHTHRPTERSQNASVSYSVTEPQQCYTIWKKKPLKIAEQDGKNTVHSANVVLHPLGCMNT